MSTTSATDSSILQCVKDETLAMTALATLLKSEQDALVDDNLHTLNEVVASKTELVRKINELERLRLSCLSNAGYEQTADGMEQHLNASPAEARLAWQELLSISEKAKEFNHTNGLLISRKLSQNQAALGVFQQGSATAALYGPNGQSSIQAMPVKGVIVR